jgi:hypothetical protein
MKTIAVISGGTARATAAGKVVPGGAASPARMFPYPDDLDIPGAGRGPAGIRALQ